MLLAHGAAELAGGRLEPRTAKTIISRAALDAELSDVRSRGHAVTDEELEPGLVAIAAPVYRAGAAVVAALSVSAPATRLPRTRFAEVAAQCMAEANALSAVLGHPPENARRSPGHSGGRRQQKEGAA